MSWNRAYLCADIFYLPMCWNWTEKGEIRTFATVLGFPLFPLVSSPLTALKLIQVSIGSPGGTKRPYKQFNAQSQRCYNGYVPAFWNHFRRRLVLNSQISLCEHRFRREYRREILLWILRRYFYLDLFWGCAATLILRKSVNELLGQPIYKIVTKPLCTNYEIRQTKVGRLRPIIAIKRKDVRRKPTHISE